MTAAATCCSQSTVAWSCLPNKVVRFCSGMCAPGWKIWTWCAPIILSHWSSSSDCSYLSACHPKCWMTSYLTDGHQSSNRDPSKCYSNQSTDSFVLNFKNERLRAIVFLKGRYINVLCGWINEIAYANCKHFLLQEFLKEDKTHCLHCRALMEETPSRPNNRK